MSNTVLTNKSAVGIIAKLAAGYLDDHIQFVKAIDKADASDFDGKNGYQAGDTVQIAIPAQFTLGTGADITSSIQDVVERKVPLTVSNQYNVPIAFTSAEIATDMAIKAWAKRILEPQMITLANNIEKACLQQAYLATFNQVGTPGSTVFDTDTILSAGQKLDEQGCADYSNRFVLLNPAANRSAVNARKGLFQQSTAIAEQYKEGAMGMADGFTFLRNNLLPTFTAGTQNVTGLTASANLTGAGSTSVALAGLGNALTVTAGTVFTINGVYDVHPVTKATLSSLKQFVVTTGGTSSAGGALTVTVAAPIYGPLDGALQNVSTLTASGSTVTVNFTASASYAQNIAFHKSAFRFVSLPLIKPDGVDMVAQETVNGITVRIVRAYDVLKDRMVMRADVLWGMANVRPEWSCRITG